MASGESDFEVVEVRREGSQLQNSTRSVSSARKRKRSADNALDIARESVRSKESATGLSDRTRTVDIDAQIDDNLIEYAGCRRDDMDPIHDIIDLEDEEWDDGAHLHWSPSPKQPPRRFDKDQFPLAWEEPDISDLDRAGMLQDEELTEMEPGSFALESDDLEFSDEETAEDAEYVVAEDVVTAGKESVAASIARGMPNYDVLDLDQLQKAVSRYGFRKSKIKTTMIRQLQQCWLALNPVKPGVKPKSKAATAKPKIKAPVAKTKGKSRADSVSSEDIPLAEQETDAKKKKTKKKEKIAKPPPMTAEELNDIFHNMIVDDNDVYSRLLRYEPLPFDELLGMGTEKGITKVGWKKDLRKYLDEQSIAFYTDDPTGPRARR